jgi:NAD(P)-dependent dehydrogenase (short-subunit alcohol dehydrogenase family)
MNAQDHRFSVTGKKALVTGGSKGIGAAIGEVLAAAGADVAILGRDRTGLKAVAEKIHALKRECFIIEADLSTVNGPRVAAQKVLQHFGVVDILVNNAGITYVEPLTKITDDHWDEIQAVNVRPRLFYQSVWPQE